MCTKNNRDDSSDDEFSDSDISLDSNESIDESDDDNNEEIVQEEEDEDEVIKAIKQANKRKNNHPPTISVDDHINKISFHPHEDLLGLANILGDVILYKYSNEENTLINTLELHTSSCRDLEFSSDGKLLATVSSDKTVMVTDMETQKLTRFFENAHDDALSCVYVMDNNTIVTGDDEGRIKLWDLRRKENAQIFTAKRNEDSISDIVTNEEQKYILIASEDGSLTSFDFQNRKFHMQSEEYEEELTCLGLFRHETKLLAGTSKGKLLLFNWNEFGLHSDIFPGPNSTINDMVPITENIVVTACEDGNLRATHLFPHRHLGVVGQHNLPIECIDICNDGTFIASSGHNNDVRFWNIEYFDDFNKVNQKHKKHQKRKELANNLPSSKVKNASDFFSDMV